MDPNSFPTKGNLILAKATLRLSTQGYDLLDKKRNVLIKEIMALNEKAKSIQASIDEVFAEAYKSLQLACIEMGMSNVDRICHSMPIEETVRVRSRSIMGVEIPIVSYDDAARHTPVLGFGNTTVAIDAAISSFNRVKELTIELSAVENAAYRLAVNIRKTQKRANALKNVTIPKYESMTKEIQETLEERERDEFTRLKVIKRKNDENRE
ncbi:MAG: V-type ATP synthase subunit D [Clostridiales bacterium]|jgi:V/A-type H+-transporting ATPase subunit D|nr:V-type ATP synthase subunit D [Clostridiales bacterium]